MPERDIESLGVMVWGAGRGQEILPQREVPPPPSSSSPSSPSPPWGPGPGPWALGPWACGFAFPEYQPVAIHN